MFSAFVGLFGGPTPTPDKTRFGECERFNQLRKLIEQLRGKISVFTNDDSDLAVEKKYIVRAIISKIDDAISSFNSNINDEVQLIARLSYALNNISQDTMYSLNQRRVDNGYMASTAARAGVSFGSIATLFVLPPAASIPIVVAGRVVNRGVSRLEAGWVCDTVAIINSINDELKTLSCALQTSPSVGQ